MYIMKEIKLTQGKLTKVDNEDYDELSKHKWCYNKGYAVRYLHKNCKATMIHMHRIVNDTPVGLQTDHIDGDTLNNQKINLRSVTIQQNQFNKCSSKNGTSKYKGVCYDSKRNLWKAQTKCLGKHIYLGRHKTEIEAAIAYNNYAKEHHGEYARLNIVD